MTSGHTGPNEGINLSRVYDPTPQRYRVLVDRLWPRGVSKQDAALDEWLKDVAPTTGLRKWYGHQPDRFVEFQRRYIEELERSPARQAVGHILDIARTEKVILLTATQDVERSAARVLLEYLHGASVHHLAAVVDKLVDGWGRDSFPASDPPGGLPPTLAGGS
jgi:uncharacterized protein YeaO (DUF488 family)